MDPKTLEMINNLQGKVGINHFDKSKITEEVKKEITECFKKQLIKNDEKKDI